ncbi:MAG: hypothetical protein IJ740_19845 [Ruminococcus sp.]|nr:hypothetical protein [Ruminococcus sp.]MBR1753098.1 hypothetical protein [Ruminococcus sp.]
MEERFFPDKQTVQDLIDDGDPVLVLIAFDESVMLAGGIDEYAEHHILLECAGYDSREIDRFFRFVADKDGADWTFVCPPDYKSIADKQRRNERFFSDGLGIAKPALEKIGIIGEIEIPKRYRRHYDFMNE